MKKSILLIAAALMMGTAAMAQARATDKTGLNVFETPKTEPAKFDGLKVNIGGAFSQSWQALYHSNTADPKVTAGVDANKLYAMKPGFNTAVANMNFDIQMAEGVYLNMTLYLSARHHNETWVKGGYIQFDKLPFLQCDLVDNIMKYTTIKAGHMEVNYGDSHFRRTDNGNAIYNPFVENNIMDEFATEIGLEADVQYNGLLGVLGVTNGEIKGDIAPGTPVVGGTDGTRNPSIIVKLGYDKQLSDKLRVRVTGSGYFNKGASSNTLFGGDRGGSNYYGVMENANTTSTAFSGRYNPGLTDKINAMALNTFVKFAGLEWFTTVESASGRSKTETADRKASQLATDLVYRFGNSENFWAGVKYNTVKAEVKGAPETSVKRIAVSGGWYMTKNIMTKVEYVKQEYTDVAKSDIRSGGKFNGLVIQAVVGF
ncbi:MAG: hypothetical protein PHV20_00840 [Bacteroidales bacterium]|nr:hypothetical protein [Bacteroidales bacterium]